MSSSPEKKKPLPKAATRVKPKGTTKKRNRSDAVGTEADDVAPAAAIVQPKRAKSRSGGATKRDSASSHEEDAVNEGGTHGAQSYDDSLGAAEEDGGTATRPKPAQSKSTTKRNHASEDGVISVAAEEEGKKEGPSRPKKGSARGKPIPKPARMPRPLLGNTYGVDVSNEGGEAERAPASLADDVVAEVVSEHQKLRGGERHKIDRTRKRKRGLISASADSLARLSPSPAKPPTNDSSTGEGSTSPTEEPPTQESQTPTEEPPTKRPQRASLTPATRERNPPAERKATIACRSAHMPTVDYPEDVVVVEDEKKDDAFIEVQDKRQKFVLQRDPNEFYVEEEAHLYHNPPMPSEHIDRGVFPFEMKKIPPPPPLPSPFPNTGRCEWSFDEDSRVMLAKFLVDESSHLAMDPVDEKFFLEMLERNDVTVISEGLWSWAKMDPSKWSLKHLHDTLREDYYHKFRRFDMVMDKDGFEKCLEIDVLYSMKVVDYVNYLVRRRQHLSKKDENVDVDPMLQFTDHNGKEHLIHVGKSAIYMIDVDILKLLPWVHDNFTECFRYPAVLPGGTHCMMNSVRRIITQNTKRRLDCGLNFAIVLVSTGESECSSVHGTQHVHYTTGVIYSFSSRWARYSGFGAPVYQRLQRGRHVASIDRAAQETRPLDSNRGS
jgi:hypothetical protein